MKERALIHLKALREDSKREDFGKSVDSFVAWGNEVTHHLYFSSSKFQSSFMEQQNTIEYEGSSAKDKEQAAKRMFLILDEAIPFLERKIGLERKSPQPEASNSDSKAASKAAPLPEHLTGEWLFKHMPGEWWVIGAGLLAAAFALGVRFAQTKAYESLVTPAVKNEAAPVSK